MNSDELPDLRSDADVDALMARIQARLAPPVPANPPAAPPRGGDAPDVDALTAYVAAQEQLAATMTRALQAIAESLEELGRDAQPPSRAKRKARR